MFPFPVFSRNRSELITVDAADFDGTNDYAVRGTSIGSSDSQSCTIVAWLYRDATGAARIFTGNTSVGGGLVNERFQLRQIVTTDVANIRATNSAGTIILDVSSSSAISNSAWTCVMGSFTLSSASLRHLYFNDTSVLSVSTYTNDTMDFTLADWSIGASCDGSGKFNGGIAEFMFFPGVYIDFSTQANRRLFISSTGKPVDPKKHNGAFATLGMPAVYFTLTNGETANNFVANNDSGTGGAFAVTGALSTFSTSPSD